MTAADAEEVSVTTLASAALFVIIAVLLSACMLVFSFSVVSVAGVVLVAAAVSVVAAAVSVVVAAAAGVNE